MDVLVDNAGISGTFAEAPDADVTEFRQVYETNVFAVPAVTNAFLPRRGALPGRTSSTSPVAPGP